MISMLILGAILVTAYDLLALVSQRGPTIAELSWKLMESPMFKTAFFLVWLWLSIHFFFPSFFETPPR